MEVPARLRQARSALSLVFIVHGAVFALLVTRIPAVQDRYGLSDGVLPLFLAAVPLLAGAGSLTASRLVRRISAPIAVRVLQPVICLTLVGVGAGRAVWQLAVCLAVFGLLVGALEATLNMTAVGIERAYGHSIMLRFHAAAGLGGITGAALAWAGADRGFSLAALYSAAVLVLLPVAAAAGARLSRVTDKPKPDGRTGPPAGTDQGRGTPWKPLLPLCLIMGVAVVADSTATNWSAKFLSDTLGGSQALATLPYGLYMAATLAGRGFGDRWVRRWGAAAVIRAGALLAAAGFALVASAPGPWAGVFGFGVLGAGLSVMIPQLFTLAARSLPGAPDTAVARVNLFNYVGFLAGPPLIGAVGAAVSYRAAMCVPLVLVLSVVWVARSLEGVSSRAPAPGPEAEPDPEPEPEPTVVR
ncbi:MFS transporter [Streptomyces katsurahamanus]|uniref:MFS transporter n=1 Tax=Streptomyces katsurahamanus TaxID=2577098 RepID=A0ABW9P3M8_9ACTN|nr:MFS transporter [Streptomyces katsurahamanus]MQS39979.1 MFS transporter [Streptomyces katsurahamanus]